MGDYAFAFYEKTSVASEDSYAYTGRDGTCKSSYTAAIPEGGVTGYKDISNEADLLDAVVNTGPVSVAIEADQMSFQMYSGGVLTGNCGTNLDHGVLAVGYGTDSGTDFWKVKNSWGSSWGMDGYVLIQRGVNKCGIADGPPSYPIVNGAPLPPTPPPPTPAPTPVPPGDFHYGQPPCRDDEKQLQGPFGSMCSKACEGDGQGNCPTDVKPGVTAVPMCDLIDEQGFSWCSLDCTDAADCDVEGGAACMVAVMG